MNAWQLHRQAPFHVQWNHADGWIATLVLTEAGQFSANLMHADDLITCVDSVLIDQAHGYEFEQLATKARAQFDAWITQHGAEALEDLPVALEITRRHANTLRQRLPELLAAAGADLPLLGALTQLKSQLERTP